MAATETLTIRLPVETKKQLGKLATQVNRTNSYLAGEAIAAYVARELEIVAGIEQGLTDMKKGRIISHAEAMDRLRKTVGSAKSVSK